MTLNEDPTLSYRLIGANLDGVMLAHIHFGGPGQTSGVAAGLFDAGGVPVDANGVLATGTIDDPELVAALLAEDPFYVNVHMTDCAAGAVRASSCWPVLADQRQVCWRRAGTPPACSPPVPATPRPSDVSVR
jgi:hypothetical protein